METMYSTPGFISEASLSGNLPRTPPYTPHRTKRRLERSDSPASATSIQPAETSSPAKKAAKRSAKDNVQVEELTEGDAGYITDIDVIYPEELEEIESESDDESSSSDGYESEAGIAHRFARLGCDDTGEAEFEKKRREKHLRRRTTSRLFKRSHSQSVKNDTEVTDPDAMADHDLTASARRLRRRVRGPEEVKMTFNDIPDNSSSPIGLAAAAEIRERWHDVDANESDGAVQNADDAMDMDEMNEMN